MRKESQRIILTRRLLQEGLLRLLETSNLEDITVTSLCLEAGINRATFYNHYTSPKALLEEMEQQLVQKITDTLQGASDRDSALNQFEQACQIVKDHSALFSILVHYHADDNLEHIFTEVSSHYSRTRMNPEDTSMDSDTLMLVSSFLYTGTYHLIQTWIRHNINKTPREIAELAYGLITPKFH